MVHVQVLLIMTTKTHVSLLMFLGIRGSAFGIHQQIQEERYRSKLFAGHHWGEYDMIFISNV